MTHEEETTSTEEPQPDSEAIQTSGEFAASTPADSDLEKPVSEGTASPQKVAEAVVISKTAAADQTSTTQSVADGPAGSGIGQSITNAFLKLYLGLVSFLKSILPDSGIFRLPPSTMAFTAIAVPLTIVAVAAVVYFQRGREAQYNIHFTAAQEAAQIAETKTDPNEQRISWEATLLHLNNAEIY
ncbi:unnamed protein product, partial [marine sediment metagenome]